MTTNAQSDDIGAIKSINASQLDSITWSADTPSDWNQFAQDFLPGASLYAGLARRKLKLSPPSPSA